jgi:hypothetical protein
MVAIVKHRKRGQLDCNVVCWSDTSRTESSSRQVSSSRFIGVAFTFSILLVILSFMWYVNNLFVFQHPNGLNKLKNPNNNNNIAPYVTRKKELTTTQQKLQRLGITPLLQPSESDTWKQTLYDRLDRLRLKCGTLCTINDVATLHKYSNNDLQVTVPDVDCHAILSMEEMDAGDLTYPSYPPDELLPFYTFNGAINVTKRYLFKQGYLGGEAHRNIVWTREKVTEQVQQARHGDLYGTYGIEIGNYVQQGLKPMQQKIFNGSILVIGSEQPWV